MNIETVESALRDMYGLIPEKDRGYADDALDTLQDFIRHYGATVETLNKVRSVIGRFDKSAA